ncbi:MULTISPECIES: hypothetical protein [unclassified Hyphomonas]|jgi:hypothetical protein|uniref:hypothetical protein n=1 Tax=unclassified Hyphomonas TaxID=2630699 RepID=UPI000458CA20|nr:MULTISPECIES: hypothetical protein [unclassified Hyphomonas]KCZ50037.1 hypothetical protein HY17_02705 [Hyphomonas sp. CY54-11-8]
MKTLASLATGLGLLVLPAAAQSVGGRLSPPLNVVQAPAVPERSDSPEVSQRQSMVIEEDGTVRFLTPAEAAELFVPSDRASEFNVELDQPDDAPDSLKIEVSGAEISETLTPDGDTRILRVVPEDGSPSWLITITKD